MTNQPADAPCSQVTHHMRKKVGALTAASTQQPQGLPQQPRQPPPKPQLKPTPPRSPAGAPATEAAAPATTAPAVASASAAAASSVKHSSQDAGKATQAQHGVPVLPAVPADHVHPNLHQASLVKAEAASRPASPVLGRDKQKAAAAGEGLPGKALQASSKQAPGSAQQQARDPGPSKQPQGRQVNLVA